MILLYSAASGLIKSAAIGGFGDSRCMMLRIWTLSGVERACLLRNGLPPRFRQRLLDIDAPMDLQLVLSPFVDAWPGHVDAIIDFVIWGFLDALEALATAPSRSGCKHALWPHFTLLLKQAALAS